jgi:glycosyltransferase involved in cell wall biosynthesis
MRARCIIVTRFSGDQPGYLDFSYRIEALARHYNVTLISDHPLVVPEMQIDGIEHLVVSGGESTFGLLRYIRAASHYIHAAQPAVVVLLHTMVAPLTYMLRGIPHVLYWNEHALRVMGSDDACFLRRWFRALKYHWLYVEAARRVELLMPIGEAHRDDLIAQGCSPARIKLIYMGVDEKFRGVALARQRLTDEPLQLIYTGTVQKARGRDVMLEGVASAAKSGVPVRLTIIGASPNEFEYCQAYAKELGIAENISMHGRIPGHDIPGFIAKADAGICIWEDQPWWRFNPPTKLFEYLVAGLPVLASNIRTHTQYIEHWHNGIIFEYDSKAFAEAVQALWRRRAELQVMKRRAFDCSERYRWVNIEPVFISAITELSGRL